MPNKANQKTKLIKKARSTNIKEWNPKMCFRGIKKINTYSQNYSTSLLFLLRLFLQQV